MDEGILEVSEVVGDRVVELRAIVELHVVGLITCGREDLVVGDEAPVGGVAQVVGHGVGVHGEEGREKDEEVRVEVKGEVEQLREKRSSWMVCGWSDGLKRRLEPMWV